jgi:hypothetical protein
MPRVVSYMYVYQRETEGKGRGGGGKEEASKIRSSVINLSILFKTNVGRTFSNQACRSTACV